MSDDDEESQEPDVSLTTEVDKKKVTEESKSTGEEESEVDEVKGIVNHFLIWHTFYLHILFLKDSL